jgi:hypothetical protein
MQWMRTEDSQHTMHVMPLPCRNPLQRQLPRLLLSQAGPHSGLCLQADYRDPLQPLTRQAKARPSQRQTTTTTTPNIQNHSHSRNHGPTVSPLPSAATGLTLQTLSKPFPRQSINLSINTSYTHACSPNQYTKQLCRLLGRNIIIDTTPNLHQNLPLSPPSLGQTLFPPSAAPSHAVVPDSRSQQPRHAHLQDPDLLLFRPHTSVASYIIGHEGIEKAYCCSLPISCSSERGSSGSGKTTFEHQHSHDSIIFSRIPVVFC